MAKTSKNKQGVNRGNNLKSVLETEGISQSELVVLSGAEVSLSTINKLANNRLGVSVTTQSKIIKALNKKSDKQYTREELFGNNPSIR